jgi:hypothetical protein
VRTYADTRKETSCKSPVLLEFIGKSAGGRPFPDKDVNIPGCIVHNIGPVILQGRGQYARRPGFHSQGIQVHGCGQGQQCAHPAFLDYRTFPDRLFGVADQLKKQQEQLAVSDQEFRDLSTVELGNLDQIPQEDSSSRFWRVSQKGDRWNRATESRYRDNRVEH